MIFIHLHLRKTTMKRQPHTENSGIKEIARLAKVSIATVDRVIHKRPGVSKKTKEKIDLLIKELDYRPNIFARRLASRKALYFVSLIPKVSKETDFWEAPLKGIQQAETEIEQNGINVKKYFFDLNNKDSFVAQTKLILASKPDGILLAPSFIKESIVFVKACHKAGIPYVLINSDLPEANSLSYIGPDLFASGHLGAHLINYLIGDRDKILIVNISKGIEKHHELLKKEEGVMAYFKDNHKKIDVCRTDIKKTDYASVAAALSGILKSEPDIRLIFVTNSRVSTVARYLEEQERRHLLLIGYDFTRENIGYLKNGTIDFLICDKPQEQGYRGIMTLYQSLVFNASVEKAIFMPIDIISKENYTFYR
jgi:LacI family transcriptional regulator